jgi:outer membrane protein assembly factor BamB
MRKSLACLAALLTVSAIQAEDWPMWRGPRGDGISSETGIPTHWSKTENIVWKVDLPGVGHSSPIISKGRIFLTSCFQGDEKRMLLCLDRKDGKILWQREVLTAKLEKKHNLNSFASATPAADGEHVYVAFLEYPRMQAVCYDYDGNLVWKKSPGEFHSVHGFCSSPVLYKDMVILNGDQDNPKDNPTAFLVSLDRKTGEERWRASRSGTRSYCTPLVVDAAGKKQLVMSGSRCITSYDPDTGKRLWYIDGPTEQFVASIVYLDNILFMSAGFPTHHLMAIRPDGEGNVTNTHVLWHEYKRAKCYVPSPIAHDKYFFVVSDEGPEKGWATCWDAKSGEMKWRQKLGRRHSASAVSAGDILYFPDDDGNTFVLKASDKFELVAKNVLGDECSASPAVSDGQIFMRTLHTLWCIGEKK